MDSAASVQVRPARPEDCAGIAAIYNAAVATTAVWNDDPVDAADRERWLAAHEAAGYPVLVAVDQLPADPGGERTDTVLGYATCDDWRPHDGFRHTVEHSVHVADGARGRGIGTALMHELIAAARARGTHVMVAAISADNPGSIAFHSRLGFRTVGTFAEVGTKFGRLLDLVVMQYVMTTGTYSFHN